MSGVGYHTCPVEAGNPRHAIELIRNLTRKSKGGFVKDRCDCAIPEENHILRKHLTFRGILADGFEGDLSQV